MATLTLQDLQDDAFQLWATIRSMEALAVKMRDHQLPDPVDENDVEALAMMADKGERASRELADNLGRFLPDDRQATIPDNRGCISMPDLRRA